MMEYMSDSSESQSSDGSEHFEGPEKNLEIDFVLNVGEETGCRALTRENLDQILSEAKCNIISKISNEHLDAYVLSESSLFVYSHKVIIKTCGTTTLLKCLPVLLRYTDRLGMEMAWLSYSRKNYLQPDSQMYPHCDFQTEISYLEAMFKEGTGYVLGPLTGDHWFVYVVDNDERTVPEATDRTLHVLMQGLDTNKAAQFFKQSVPTSREMTKLSGIDKFIPGSIIDDCAFDPCGYSMNGIIGESYFTIHITPESHCSYASFETNVKEKTYRNIIDSVIDVFGPDRFTVTLYADEGGVNEMVEDPFAERLGGETYKRKSLGTTHFEGDYTCIMGNWVKCKRRGLTAI